MYSCTSVYNISRGLGARVHLYYTGSTYYRPTPKGGGGDDLDRLSRRPCIFNDIVVVVFSIGRKNV